MGLGDKGVSLLYERVLRKEKQLDLWVERCKSQISGVLEVLEKERAAVKTPYWSGENIGHADIAVACVLRFTGEAHPALFDARYPALKAHSERCEALPPFQEIVQPLAPPKGANRTTPFFPSPLAGEGGAKRRMRGCLRGERSIRGENPSPVSNELTLIRSTLSHKRRGGKARGIDLPDNARSLAPLAAKNISLNASPKSELQLPPSCPTKRGVGHRHERWDGLRWTRWRRAREGIAGRLCP